MKKLFFGFLMLTALVVVSGAVQPPVKMIDKTAPAAVVGCANGQGPDAKTVIQDALTASQIACVIANVLLPDAQAVAQACNIDSKLVPIVDQTLGATRKANAKYAASQMAAAKCKAADAGP